MSWWMFGKPDPEQEIENLSQSVIGLLALIEKPGFSQPLRKRMIAQLRVDIDELGLLAQDLTKSGVVKRLVLIKTKFHSGAIWDEMKKFSPAAQEAVDTALEIITQRARNVEKLLK